MGRRKNNPSLVQKLISTINDGNGLEWEDDYNTLSSSDKKKVDEAVDEMDLLYSDDLYLDQSDEDEGERLSACDAALIWASSGKDEDYTFGYTESELEDSL